MPAALGSSMLDLSWGSTLLLAAGGGHDPFFYERLAGVLPWFYITIAVMNGLAALYVWQTGKLVNWFRIPILDVQVTNGLAWMGLAALATVLAAFAGSENPSWMPHLPAFLIGVVNDLADPKIYSIGTTAALLFMYWYRRFFVQPWVAWLMLNLALFGTCFAMLDPNFYVIVAKPDNVPIVMLVFLLGYFTWLGTYQAVVNDERLEQGKPPLEKENDEKVLVWPDLVYTELVCMIALTAFLILWAVLLQAPLEEPASAVKTPNPSKAPWYFLGLQEMLVYYDPWMAGVVLPSLIIVGLMAIPYIDFNKKGNGYYTIKERRFAYLVFQIGFLELWVTLIVLGTLLRGPNWNFYGPFEYWNPYKVEALNNVNLSEMFWVLGLERDLPSAPAGASWWQQIGAIVLREAPGILLVAGYFFALPAVLGVTVLRGFFLKMGLIRFLVLANLLLFMASLPIKMLLRWLFNLKYLIAIPEYFLNF